MSGSLRAPEVMDKMVWETDYYGLDETLLMRNLDRSYFNEDVR